MPIWLIAIVLAAFAVLAWRDFKLALTLILALLPTYLLRFELVIPWTLLEGFILIAFALWLFGHNGFKLDLRTLGKYRAPLFFLLAMATFATIWAPDQSSALGVWKAYFIEPMLMFVMLRSTFTERADWTRALTTLGITTILIAVFAIFQKLTGLGLPIPWDVERRATSVFEYPNAVGLLVAPIVTALCVARPRVAIIAVPLGLVAILLAETEAALVAIPVALLATLLMSRATAKTKITALIGSVVVAVAVLAIVPTVCDKVLLQDYSGGVRRAQWSETVELLKDRPLDGAGLSGYPTVFEPYHDPTLYEVFQYPHNVILNFWVEMGLIGVMAFVWIAVVTTRLAWGRRDDALVLAAFAALLNMTIHGLVDVPFFKNDLAVLTAFFLAMVLAPSAHSESPSRR
jgi:O-antigen ligase